MSGCAYLSWGSYVALVKRRIDDNPSTATSRARFAAKMKVAEQGTRRTRMRVPEDDALYEPQHAPQRETCHEEWSLQDEERSQGYE